MVSDPLFDQLAKIPGGKPIVYSQEGKSPMNLGNNWKESYIYIADDLLAIH